MENTTQNVNILVGKEIIIKLLHDKVFLSPIKQLDTKQLRYNSQLKYFRTDAYWKVNVLSWTTDKKGIHVEVVDYFLGEVSFPIKQIEMEPLLAEIEYVTFRKIETEGLLLTTIGQKEVKGNYRNFFENQKVKNEIEKQDGTVKDQNDIKGFHSETLTRTFTVKIKDLTFVNGGVSCVYINNEFRIKFDLFIPNPNIRKEFNELKSYFEKVLKKKTFEICLTFQKEYGITTLSSSSSKEVDEINDNIIERIKYEIIRSNLNKSMRNSDLRFIEIDHLKKIGKETDEITAIQIDNNDLFNKVLEIKNVQHQKSLKYLASKHLFNVMKLRYFTKPFSFLFLIERENAFYYVWETHNTKEATYIWKTEKNKEALKDCFLTIESSIKEMKVEGKLAYLSENNNNCKRIRHNYSDPDLGFAGWLKDLEKHIQN